MQSYDSSISEKRTSLHWLYVFYRNNRWGMIFAMNQNDLFCLMMLPQLHLYPQKTSWSVITWLATKQPRLNELSRTQLMGVWLWAKSTDGDQSRTTSPSLVDNGRGSFWHPLNKWKPLTLVPLCLQPAQQMSLQNGSCWAWETGRFNLDCVLNLSTDQQN